MRTLTKRQKEIMEYVILGLSNREIAEKMNLAESCVKMHMSNIRENLGVINRLQATICYLIDYKGIEGLKKYDFRIYR